jgi:hypothetical protein
MTRNLPATVREILISLGEVAAELSCQIEGYREFVTIFRFQTAQVVGFQSQFPNLADCEVAFRLMRFRVGADLIRNDYDCCVSDLVGLQSIYVATEEDVLDVLQIWAVSAELLRAPRETEVPI